MTLSDKLWNARVGTAWLLLNIDAPDAKVSERCLAKISRNGIGNRV